MVKNIILINLNNLMILLHHILNNRQRVISMAIMSTMVSTMSEKIVLFPRNFYLFVFYFNKIYLLLL